MSTILAAVLTGLVLPLIKAWLSGQLGASSERKLGRAEAELAASRAQARTQAAIDAAARALPDRAAALDRLRKGTA